MDGGRFDGLVRGLVTGSSRRTVLKGVAAAVAGAAGIRIAGTSPSAKALTPPDTRCRTEQDCPLGTCDLSSPVRYTGSCNQPEATCGDTFGLTADCGGGSGYCDEYVMVPGAADSAACREALGDQNAYRGPSDDDRCYRPIFTGICVEAVCASLGESCSRDRECCDGVCFEETCRHENGKSCRYGAQCVSGSCIDVTGNACGAAITGAECICAARAAETALITVHYRACPETATEITADCHDHPLAGASVLLSNGDSGVTDERGNHTFTVAGVGPWTMSDRLGIQPLGVFCALSDRAETGRVFNTGMTLTLPDPDVDVICDIYYASAPSSDVASASRGKTTRRSKKTVAETPVA